MIFETLAESNAHGELLLIDGGYCRWHKRRDATLVIYEILSQRPGAGQEILARLCAVPGIVAIVAKCPADLPANDWYERRGFVCIQHETTRNGRTLRIWRLHVAGLQQLCLPI